MRINEVRRALADVASRVKDPAGGYLHGYAYVENRIDDPAFIVADYRIISFDETFHGRYEIEFTCWLHLSTQVPSSAQERMDIMLSATSTSDPTTSLYWAMMDAKGPIGVPALGVDGTSNMHLMSARTTPVYQVGERDYLGSELKIMVWGESLGN